eukprot:TRINITY_DN67330_c9_g1_i1.p1 TRINITY_DN67330_c9_g1~~TRINITY_DN67330_c9_g1_i1.p1  ORF type:complete len:248 (-),score=36.08 TRINITY_DN67330_c9_g1_i1:988-1656(-)
MGTSSEVQKPREYFIDRSPVAFGVILEYLRSGNVMTANLSADVQHMLANDLEFYGISNFPLAAFCWDRKSISGGKTSLMFVDDDRTLVCLKRKDLRSITAIIPPRLLSSSIVQWTVEARINQTWQEVGLCSVGARTSSWAVYIAVVTGMCKFLKEEEFAPFIQWPKKGVCRTISFVYDKNMRQLVISAVGGTFVKRIENVKELPKPFVILNPDARRISFTLN